MQDERESVRNKFSIDERDEAEMSKLMGKKSSSHSRNYDAENVKSL